MWYFPIGLLSCPWHGSYFATAGHGHLAPTGCTSSYSNTIICDVWPPVLVFPGPNCKASTVCPHVGLHSHGGLCEAVPWFVMQTGGQGLALVSAQTLSNNSIALLFVQL